LTETKTFLESVWEQREEVHLFKSTFGKSCDPRWLHIGVFECQPTAERPTWAYVSSGLSNPWELDAAPSDPSALSGLGVEYVFNTTAQAEWAIQLVQYVTAYELLLNHGSLPGRGPIEIGDRIPAQIRDRSDRLSLLRQLMVIKPAFVPARHQLASGGLAVQKKGPSISVVGSSDAKTGSSTSQRIFIDVIGSSGEMLGVMSLRAPQSSLGASGAPTSAPLLSVPPCPASSPASDPSRQVLEGLLTVNGPEGVGPMKLGHPRQPPVCEVNVTSRE